MIGLEALDEAKLMEELEENSSFRSTGEDPRLLPMEAAKPLSSDRRDKGRVKSRVSMIFSAFVLLEELDQTEEKIFKQSFFATQEKAIASSVFFRIHEHKTRQNKAYRPHFKPFVNYSP